MRSRKPTDAEDDVMLLRWQVTFMAAMFVVTSRTEWWVLVVAGWVLLAWSGLALAVLVLRKRMGG